MGRPLEPLAQLICGTIANGRVADDLVGSWDELFRPDFARLGLSTNLLAVLLRMELAIALESLPNGCKRYRCLLS